jgi:hypothetical protein
VHTSGHIEIIGTGGVQSDCHFLKEPYIQNTMFFGGSVLFYSSLKFFELEVGAKKLACLTHATDCTIKNTVAKNKLGRLQDSFSGKLKKMVMHMNLIQHERCIVWAVDRGKRYRQNEVKRKIKIK